MLKPGRTKGNISTSSEKNSWLKKIKTQNNPWEELLSMRTWKHLDLGSSSHAETALAWPLNLHPKLLLVLTATGWSGALKTPLGLSCGKREHQTNCPCECAVLSWFPALATLRCAPGWLVLSVGDAFAMCCFSWAAAHRVLPLGWAIVGVKQMDWDDQDQEIAMWFPVPESSSLATFALLVPSESKSEPHPPCYQVHCNPEPIRAGETYSFVFRDQMENVMMV